MVISFAAGSLVLRPGGASLAASRPHMPAMPFPTMPDPAVDRQRDHDRRHPERETLELAAAGVAQVLGPDHGVARALARAAITMAKANLWRGSGTTIT